MHEGKWTKAEEQYLAALIDAFDAGVVPIPEGISLRVFLSSMLNCPGQRISKKMVGTSYNGRQLYSRRPGSKPSDFIVKKHQKMLREMEEKYITSLAPIIRFREMTKQQESATNLRDQQERVAKPVAAPNLHLEASPALKPSPQASTEPTSLPWKTPNPNSALKVDSPSLSRLIQLHSLRESLQNKATPGLSITNDRLPGANTPPNSLGVRIVILSLVCQNNTPGLTTLTIPSSHVAPPPLYHQHNPTGYLIERLKRKFEQQEQAVPLKKRKIRA